MAPLPPYTLLVRTDFTDDAAWETLLEAVTTPSDEGFLAEVLPINDPDYNGWTWGQLQAATPRTDGGPQVLFIADTVTIANTDQPIHVIDLLDDDWHQRAAPFRVIPGELWNVENNLTIGNMQWEEFADRLDEHGVFRGFSYRRPRPPRLSGRPSEMRQPRTVKVVPVIQEAKFIPVAPQPPLSADPASSAPADGDGRSHRQSDE
jgi:hypothetical protein